MKEGIITKIAAFLLIATLITTSITSGVIAQYTSKAESTSSAHVAQWGVVTFAEGALFTDRDSAGGYSVAPGDFNDAGLSFGLSGTAEVDGEISMSVNQKNIFLAGGTWGIMMEDTTVTADKLGRRSVAVEMPEETEAELETEELETTPPTEAETPAETEETETESLPQEEPETAAIVTSPRAITQKRMAGNGIENTYYILDNGVYREADGQSFDPNERYYVLSYEVAVEPTGYWPVVFQMNGADSVGYIENIDAQTRVNTLEGVSGTLVNALPANPTFKAHENIASKFQLSHQRVTWAWDNCKANCQKDGITISGGQSASLCEICRRDIILQKLMSADTSNARVVKASGDGTYAVPVASVSGAYDEGDYCLNVNFDLNLAARQVK